MSRCYIFRDVDFQKDLWGIKSVARYRIASIFLWLMALLQQEINFTSILLVILAFSLMSISWSLFGSLLVLASLAGILYFREDDIYLIISWVLFVTILFMVTFTTPYGTAPQGDFSGYDYSTGITDARDTDSSDSGGDGGGD